MAANNYPEGLSFEQLNKKLTRVLADKDIKRFFLKKDTVEIHNEQEIVFASGASVRIDRLVVDGDKAFVIDYKSSRTEGEGYNDQVKRYVSAVKQIYPGKKIEGYIVYLDEIKAELVK